MPAFAHRCGLNAQRLSWWRKRLGTDQAGRAPMAFIPAVVAGPTAPVTVRLPCGVEVETIDLAAVPPRWVARLVRALGISA